MTAEMREAHEHFLRRVVSGEVLIENKALLADIRREHAAVEKKRGKVEQMRIEDV